MSILKVNAIRATAASSDAITLATDGTCTAKVTNNLSNRNLIINGAMQIAQRGTSATSTGFQTVDRWKFHGNWPGSAITTAQSDVAAGTTPYEKGFRKAWKVTNVSQSSAGAANYLYLRTALEAQDVATSGWDYTDANSKVTLSFWVKSSIAQNNYGYFRTIDGTQKMYPFETGSLTADTWTKVTKTIPGHADLQFDNNNGNGLDIMISPFWGTNYTSSSVSLHTWSNNNDSERFPDYPTTWFLDNGATFEITGVQLEVGDYPSSFEFRSYGDELQRCRRYFYMHANGADAGGGWVNICQLTAWSSSSEMGMVYFPVAMRTTPSLYKVVGTDYFRCARAGGYQDSDDVSLDTGGGTNMGHLMFSDDIASTAGYAGYAQIVDGKTAARIGFDAEL